MFSPLISGTFSDKIQITFVHVSPLFGVIRSRGQRAVEAVRMKFLNKAYCEEK
jgi:hypothetical protein